MVNYWLAKQEPSSYNFEKLKNDKETVWDEVHNNLALKNLNKMDKGDLVMFYHSGKEKQIVGLMEVIKAAYPNPNEKNNRYVVVDVKYKKPLKRPVTLHEIKTDKFFKDWELLRISRLSVMPVPQTIWKKIIEISET